MPKYMPTKSVEDRAELGANPFSEGDPRHEAWLRFSSNVNKRLIEAADYRKRLNEKLQEALSPVIKASPELRERSWAKALTTLRSIRPDVPWPNTVPADENQLVRMLLDYQEDPEAAVVRRLHTLAGEALENYVVSKEDIDRYEEILRSLTSSALAVFSEPSRQFLKRVKEGNEHWREMARKYAENASLPPRRWNIEVSGDQERMEGCRTEYQAISVDLLDARGLQFDHPFQAADTLLELLREYLARIKSPYLTDLAIRPLCLATAKYCSDQRTRAIKKGNRVEARLFGEFRQRCLELAEECGESREDRRNGLYAIWRGMPDLPVRTAEDESLKANQGQIETTVPAMESATIELSGSPEDRLADFMRGHPGTTYADIKFSSKVHTAEFQDWRRGKLSAASVMSQRIEKVLNGATRLSKKPRKSRAD